METLRQFQGVEDFEERLTRLARERYETIKTRDIPWDIYLALMRGVVRNILEDRESGADA
jgi:hypothetical protein